MLLTFSKRGYQNSLFQIWKERKTNKIWWRISTRLVSVPQYNTSLSTCIPNMTILACMVSQKSLKKNFIIQSMERKKIGQIQGRISRRRLVRNPTIKYIIINLHTIYDYSSLHSFTEIWDEKFHYSSMERFVVVALLFYVHGKHLRSCRHGQLT